MAKYRSNSRFSAMQTLLSVLLLAGVTLGVPCSSSKVHTITMSAAKRTAFPQLNPSQIEGGGYHYPGAGTATSGGVFPTASGMSDYGVDDTSGYWVANIERQGQAAFNSNPSGYKIFRNVKDYGAKGDGSSDDTQFINDAITDGNRCGKGCDSSTTTPAIIYFPPGTYMVSKPIVQLYYTQFIGDATKLPVIKAAPSFQGIAVIDSDPYEAGGVNWYTNTNNFYRQIRNFVIDLTAMPPTAGAGIHWQVAQATSLQNIRFEMVKGGANNAQQGIFMDNGSGGLMIDLTFNGGNYGAFFGNQQFTVRNMTFNDCNTAILMNFAWVWTLKSITVNNCQYGMNMTNKATVGSVLLQDSKISATKAGIITDFDKSGKSNNNTLNIDNVDFSGTPNAVVDINLKPLLAGGNQVASWAQGNQYTSSGGATPQQERVQQPLTMPQKGAALLGGDGKFFEKSKPQYEDVPASSFVSVRSKGAKGDGQTDDTAALQSVFDNLSQDQIAYIDHGAYRVTKTITIKPGTRITGEIWPIILADGQAFQDESNPTPVFQVGKPGDTGSVELSDFVFETLGPQKGAVMIEWNMKGSAPGAAGMWDVHVRLGGTAGTKLQSDTCTKNPNVTAPANQDCISAFMMFHMTKQASAYLENTWFWVADHELDLGDHNQINVFTGRGVLIESQGPAWLYGTASEHAQLYEYQLNGAKDIYMGVIQTETPYYQSNPNAMSPFNPQNQLSDPDFSGCSTDNCRKAWGLRVLGSSDILVYGAGLYSFFDNWDQTCTNTESCQENMVQIDSSTVSLYGLSTKASTNMVTLAQGSVPQADNRDVFCSTLALFEATQ